MRITVAINDDLYRRSLEVADPAMDEADLFREPIKTFIRIKAGQQLAALGGAMPEIPDIPRKKGT